MKLVAERKVAKFSDARVKRGILRLEKRLDKTAERIYKSSTKAKGDQNSPEAVRKRHAR